MRQVLQMAGQLGQLRLLRVSAHVFRKEWASFLGSNLPVVALAVTMVACGLLNAIVQGQSGATYEQVARGLFYVYYVGIMIAALTLSMAAFVNERRQGTLELLYTLPVSDLELTLGKYAMGVISILVLAFLVVAINIFGVAEAPLAIAFTGFVGLLLGGLFYYSVGMFASSISDNQLVSIAAGFGLAILFEVVSFAAGLLPEPARSILTYPHGLNQFFAFTRGVIPLKGVVFFGSMTVLFLFLTVKVLESRRWRAGGN
ncbi:MAG: ABC transporter permease [Leptospirales bacterium]|nr:ABC transporter permease [Leptospirales bacterium]